MADQPIHSRLRAVTLAFAVCMAGCNTVAPMHDDNSLQREAVAGTEKPVPASLPLNTELESNATTKPAPQISRGTGHFIQPTPLPTPRRAATGANAVTFNFENQPVQAVVKAILGDLLQQNYTIVPGVQGNISFSTSEPVDSAQALPILETLLSWTHNALVERDGRYVVMPDKDAVAGNLAPSLGAAAPQGGMQARLFPLHYIAAGEMEKLLKPFVRPDSILLTDNARNVIVVAGTPDDLANYARTVHTFDVDWLRGMSVGVYSLQHATVDEVMPQLDQMFGAKGNTPLAGMLRFMPIKRTNALVVISTQPEYLDEVGSWIDKMDLGGGNESQLYVYDVRNIKASDLAHYLGEIYGDSSGNGSDKGGSVGPGMASTTLGLGNNSSGSASGLGSSAGSFGSSTTGSSGLGSSIGTSTGTTSGFGSSTGSTTGGFGSSSTSSGTLGSSSGTSGTNGSGGNQDQQYTSKDGSIRISSVDDNNQLLVLSRPAQWGEIQNAIKRLDVPPLQVQIETRIFEVALTGDFQFGVQWYLEGLTGSTTSTDSTSGATTITPGQPYRHRQIALGGGGNQYNGDSFFYSFMNSKMQVAVSAMETDSNTKTLSAPSLVVLNNQMAHIQVGDQVPVNQTYFTAGLGSVGNSETPSTVGQVSYIPTGVILDVQPRVNPGGLVYLNIDQQVSATGTKDQNGNYTISQRQIATQLGVQSGQTVLLGGLIQQQDTSTNTGIPGLNSIPVLGRLFGTTSRNRTRTELIVLITPRVITSAQDAKQVTDEYQDKFESLKPLRGAAPTGIKTDSVNSQIH